MPLCCLLWVDHTFTDVILKSKRSNQTNAHYKQTKLTLLWMLLAVFAWVLWLCTWFGLFPWELYCKSQSANSASCGGDAHPSVCCSALALHSRTWWRRCTSGRDTCSRRPSTISSSRSWLKPAQQTKPQLCENAVASAPPCGRTGWTSDTDPAGGCTAAPCRRQSDRGSSCSTQASNMGPTGTTSNTNMY